MLLFIVQIPSTPLKRMGKKDLIQMGINRFFTSTSLYKRNVFVLQLCNRQSGSLPTLEEIENDPKQYYPFLVEILQCFGSNYFDKQGTERGRGGEISISQKVNGILDRIAMVLVPSSLQLQVEKQWQTDEKNPDFPYIRKAWRKCISALWERIWK